MSKALRIILAALALLGPQLSRAASPQESREPGETIIVSGGVSLWIWEKYKAQPHDKWWLNFIRAAQLRIAEIQRNNPQQPITWLVYRPAYISRGRQDSQDYTSFVNGIRDGLHVRLMWFDTTSQLLNYINRGQPRDRLKINDLEFFCHSNKACFLFDYSNIIDSASKVWLHENDLTKINRGVFTKDALVRSFGCHTGESMSSRFRSATGIRMWGLTGKSQYMTDELPVPASDAGRWTR
ncbi:MAG: hypothetical protein ABI318_05250 [Chthoniobacteraceae bacterium]